MFYLLEDNRIIKYSEKFSHIFCYENRKGLLYKVFSDKNYGKNRKIGKIKKQSENVFDLIEENDLVMVDRTKIYSNFYPEPIIEISTVFWSDSHHSLCVYPRGNGYYCPIIDFGVQKGILAIYKPNSKGDYIKVWEKKDDK